MSENKIATKADLQRMYNKMLPYLGGMPEMVANKFSKGDLYSTEERMIGQWIDGKPLYQKILKKSNVVNQTEIYFTEMDSVSFDLVTYSYCFKIRSSDKLMMPIPWHAVNQGSSMQGYDCSIQIYPNDPNERVQISVSTNISRAAGDYYVILNYTKTTDSSISIGSDTDYSTEEKIVGTWIDGKPVYQKTVNCGALPNKTTKQIIHGISGIDKVIKLNGFAWRGSNSTMITLPYINNQLTSDTRVMAQTTSNNILIGTSQDMSSFTESYITLQYTKTTD